MRKYKFLLVCIALILSVQKSFSQFTYNTLKVAYDLAWTFKNLQIIPVRFKDINNKPGNGKQGEGAIVSFADALQKHKIKLQEIKYENGADVNWLQVTNNSKQSVLVQSGEIVSGGKQDRMMAETKLLPPGKSDYLHVYCVEKRRWDKKPKEFNRQGVGNNELRKAMDLSGRQHDVWKEIDRQYGTAKKTSETFSYLQLYKDSMSIDTSYLRYFMQKYRESDSVFAGYIFITGGNIMGCELFSSPELTDISFGNMLRSYIHSAIKNGSPPTVSGDKIKSFTDRFLTDEPSQKIYVIAHGKMHSAEGKIIHLIAYDQ